MANRLHELSEDLWLVGVASVLAPPTPIAARARLPTVVVAALVASSPTWLGHPNVAPSASRKLEVWDWWWRLWRDVQFKPMVDRIIPKRRSAPQGLAQTVPLEGLETVGLVDGRLRRHALKMVQDVLHDERQDLGPDPALVGALIVVGAGPQMT